MLALEVLASKAFAIVLNSENISFHQTVQNSKNIFFTSKGYTNSARVLIHYIRISPSDRKFD